ncbi:hypothetical protein AMTR_s00339p00009640 [Amborella trichopoda]|uniref:Uncharacterized protein n=1 Tax=Amborella trichopoda TaxID=13333 RepID=W1NWA6_AMBTC|nr:hypothetical protein AMTR_s00339p00009640 [Amborella trichopoda]
MSWIKESDFPGEKKKCREVSSTAKFGKISVKLVPLLEEELLLLDFGAEVERVIGVVAKFGRGGVERVVGDVAKFGGGSGGERVEDIVEGFEGRGFGVF